jgi:hypothetical protein
MTTTMTGVFSAFADSVQQLHASVVALDHSARFLALGDLRTREWFQSLEQKLVPQLKDEAFLVVAVVGGTNIGKSVIFNHIAGWTASAVSPLASGTRHPVCLVPLGFEKQHNLGSVFEGFELVEWSREDDPLRGDAEDLLFWKVSDRTPPNLLILDTPDIDSDAQVNWHRADSIRRVSDVLIAVLTQQKYNDAAVKRFFRKAAADDKAVIVVFNQCLLPDDEAFWPLWLQTFCRETGVKPEFVYVAPNDRRAAERGTLTYFERHWNGPCECNDRCSGSRCDRVQPFRRTYDCGLRGSLRTLRDAPTTDGCKCRRAELSAGNSRAQRGIAFGCPVAVDGRSRQNSRLAGGPQFVAGRGDSRVVAFATAGMVEDNSRILQRRGSRDDLAIASRARTHSRSGSTADGGLSQGGMERHVACGGGDIREADSDE